MKNKAVIIIFAFLTLTILARTADARSGCCSWHGGVCGYGCCDGTPLSDICAPYYSPPSYSPPSYTPTPIYIPPQAPTCPSMSYYDSLSDSCKCYSGYRVGSNLIGQQACISDDDYCKNLFGYNTHYDSLSGRCECLYGYVVNNNSCVYGNTYCHNQLGIMSSYDSLSKTCGCDYGYYYNGSICISKNTPGLSVDYSGLSELLNSYQSLSCPVNSSPTTDGKCNCNVGYQSNVAKDGCEVACPLNSTKIGNSCTCHDGYVMSNNQCITNTQDCINSFGANVTGVKNIEGTGTSTCYCASGYQWNAAKTSCIQTPSIQITSFTKILRLGNRGDEVKRLQQLLIQKKFLKANTLGYFGAATRTALKKFQKANNLKQSGLVDTATLNFLNSQ